MSLEIKSQDKILEAWAADGLFEIKHAVDVNDVAPLGWSHDVDVFETAVKVLLIVEVLLRYGCGGSLIGVLKELRSTLMTRMGHEYWIEKTGQIVDMID